MLNNMFESIEILPFLNIVFVKIGISFGLFSDGGFSIDIFTSFAIFGSILLIISFLTKKN